MEAGRCFHAIPVHQKTPQTDDSSRLLLLAASGIALAETVFYRGKNQLASYAWGSDDFKTAAFRIGSLFALVVCPTVNGHWDRLGGMICK